MDPSLFGGLSFRFVGPSRGGRVTAVEGHRSHPHTFYHGATGGGVWKTTNYGMSWENISDGYFASPSIGHIEVADSDPSTIYVGTGSDGIRSNIIIGKGVYKSTDAGETWAHVGLEDGGQIPSVKAHPDNPDLVYAAAMGNPFKNNDTRGVYRSSNGGLDWERILFTSDSVGAVDLEFHPENPDIIYAAMWRAQRYPWSIVSGAEDEDGIWKTADGGETWRRITAGLPEGLIGKVDFSVSADMPDRVYALVEAPEPIEGLYRSEDAGETWTLINDDPRNQLMHRPFYFTNIIADPTDGDVVYVLNLATWKSTDGGRTFATIPNVHGDDHDLWINPDDSRVMVHGSDGGGVVTLDGGQTWSPVNNQPTAELYQVDVDDRFPYWLYAGQQDDAFTVSVPRPATIGLGAGRAGRVLALAGRMRDGTRRAQAGRPGHRVRELQGALWRLQPAHGAGAAVLRGRGEHVRHEPPPTCPTASSAWSPSRSRRTTRTSSTTVRSTCTGRRTAAARGSGSRPTSPRFGRSGRWCRAGRSRATRRGRSTTRRCT